ncbi:MAG: DUF134 domain-containing protein [Actinomycetota bacterium]
MPRPRKPRCVRGEPAYGFFKPRGIPLKELEVVKLSVEELEALRLADIEELYHEDAALYMEVSRPTFHRILKGAHHKVAQALVEGKALGIEGGDYVLAGDTRIFECVKCGHTREEPFGTGARACESVCPECGGRVTRKACGGGLARRGRGPCGRQGPTAPDPSRVERS